jgi:hypothetical protein
MLEALGVQVADRMPVDVKGLDASGVKRGTESCQSKKLRASMENAQTRSFSRFRAWNPVLAQARADRGIEIKEDG